MTIKAIPWGKSSALPELVFVPKEAIIEVCGPQEFGCNSCALGDHGGYIHDKCESHPCGNGLWVHYLDAVSIKLGSKP